MQVVTWNVAQRGTSLLEALAGMCAPDLITLQEVRLEHPDGFRKGLVEMGLQFVHYSRRVDLPCKSYVNMIASRWPLDAVELRYPRKELPWPQALTEVSISVGGRSIAVITSHMPNGARNGWDKIDTFQVLRKLVGEAKGRPCIVTGDLNEPQFGIHHGRVLTWGQEEGRFKCWNKWTFNERTGTGEEWDAAVRSLFEGQAEHGLRHAYWEAHGQGRRDASHLSRGQKRWFDHIFVSADFRVELCEYLHKLRGPGLSDHSALTARLAFGAES